ncbi:hypothetical protein HK104_007924 [Borealophlyctis nickersoniae]|nr:hypothetical protein HK104_007924 [Borealophlyctis nickersoniae]
MPAQDMPSDSEQTQVFLQYLKTLTPTTPSPETEISSLLSSGANLHYRCPTTGTTPLHIAATSGNLAAVKAILSAGHPWNAVDDNGKSAGECAKEAGWDKLYDFMVEEGVRVEFILKVLDATGDGADDMEQEEVNDTVEEARQEASEASEKDEPPTDSKKPSNATYLASSLTYSSNTLLDADSNAVMMGWEAPLMTLHAAVIAPQPGLDVLNIGFGLGLIDEELQKRKPRTHTIVEAHPDVYKKMLDDGWDKKEGVRIVFGRWQDVLHELEVYDGIFFDTFGENYDDLKEFHEHLPNILRETGTYSFFNGLAGTNSFFHDVSCRIAQFDLAEIGLDTTYEEVEVDKLGDDVATTFGWFSGFANQKFSTLLYGLVTKEDVGGGVFLHCLFHKAPETKKSVSVVTGTTKERAGYGGMGEKA